MKKAESIEKWKALYNEPDIETLNKDINILHHASQLIALAGHYYGEPKEDDSNTAFRFSCKNECFTGVNIGIEKPLIIGLNLKSFKLLILDENKKPIKKLKLDKCNFQSAFDFIKKSLENHGFNTGVFLPEMHYEIPGFDFNPDYIFKKPSKQSLEFHIALRNNFQVISKLFTSVFTSTSEVLIWPHHFDSAVLIYSGGSNLDGKESTVGLGLAIADDVAPEPYFYVNPWAKKGIKYPKQMPELPSGKWGEKDWKGAYLTLSELMKAETGKLRYQRATSFYSSAIETSHKILI